ncbi:hypothetical protein KJ951_03145 [Patescibacteria group bacterium]|nr:hypothetical protein [Patescibacteria group bacterium]MBU1703375.1 hypothetical protein [Patescibacteria group bacterium]MBU1953343.1 hypothetical protein [Patescibacteria group bacterium]
MKKILQKLVSTLIICLALLPAHAANAQGTSLFCDGFRDWGTFISATASFDDFLEYWKDILVRYNTNYCLYLDIDNLLNRITKVRAQIRDAFYTCAGTAQMTKTYYELEAEIFFLRKYIDVDTGSFLVVDDAKVIKELRDYFVINKGFFSDAEITQLFDRFKKRYDSRLDSYRDCKDPAWGALVEKWNQFKDDIAGILPAITKMKESVEKSWDRMAKAPWRRGGDFFAGFIDARINLLPAELGIQQIGEELKKLKPEGYTFQEFQTTQAAAETNFQYAKQQQDYLSGYQAQFGEGSDTFTTAVVGSLNALQATIKGTFPYQNQVTQCTKAINNKQC